MANENNDTGFHGYLYLVDTANTRQYAIRFDHGKTSRNNVFVFAQDEREARFKPNETVFALGDENTIDTSGDKAIVSTVAFQITTDGSGTPVDLKSVGVEYEVSFDFNADSEDIDITYSLTAESAAELARNGFSASFPKNFSDVVSLNDPGVHRRASGVDIDPGLLSNLSFPPHHDGGAIVARTNINSLTPETPIVAPRQEEPAKEVEKPAATKPSTTPSVTPEFNRTVNKVPAPPVLDRPKISDAAIEAVIKQFCDDLTEKAEQGRLDPIVGRDTETDQSLKVLSRRKQASLCYTGDAGVGKTAMFSAVAQRLADNVNIPDSLRGARVLSLDLQAMNAGAKFRGEFEAKLKPLIDGLKEREGYLKGRKIILAIDELHSQLTSGKAEGGTDAGNMMKPFLTAKGISVMGTTTGEEYRKHVEKDGALSSRFEQMVLEAPNEENTRIILNRLWPLIKAHHGLEADLTTEQMDYIVTMTNRYAPNESQPRKGEKALDMAAASATFRHSKSIETQDIVSAVAQMSKLTEDFLNQSDHERFLKMETDLPNEVLGQPRAIERVVNGLIGSRSGLNDPNQPWGCFVFQGPTGTGKTELCKALARYLFGTDDALIKIDMSEYGEKHTVSRLIGAPPGYVGFDSTEPALTERIRQRPYSILLLDEIEKAHPDVFNVLLPILNDGKMTDNQGKTVLFNNVIVVMTSNMGAEKAMAVIEGKGGIGFGNDAAMRDPEKLEAALNKAYADARKERFRPEMINRIEELGGFATFLPLTSEVITNLVEREVRKVSKRLSDPTGATLKNVTLEVSKDVEAQLAKEGYVPSMGARPLRKVIREKIANPLGKYLMANKADVLKFADENGGAKIFIDSLTNFAPQLMPAEAPAVTAEEPSVPASNDNAGKEIPDVRLASRRHAKNTGGKPSQP